jgi:hypothetical protein
MRVRAAVAHIALIWILGWAVIVILHPGRSA